MRTVQKILSLVICLAMAASGTAAAAEGSGNIDGGGGNINQGVEGYMWYTGFEGVRLTLVDAETGIQSGPPIDFTNCDLSAVPAVIFNFGKVSKLQYRSGAALAIQTDYHYHIPETPLPKIISTNSGKADMDVIKKYFCSEGAANMAASYTGIHPEDMVSGKYKMVIEPIIYLWYDHLYFAMTVTEAGLYNQMT